MIRHDTARQVILTGQRTIDALSTELDTLGAASVAVITSPTAARSEGYARTRAALAGRRIVAEFTTVAPHAPMRDSETLAAGLADDPPDAIVAYGGGSASDTAKAVSILLAEQTALADCCSTFIPPETFHHVDLPAPKTPVVSVPTTLSGAEITPGGGATDEAGLKRVFWDPKIASRVVIYDAAAMASVPADIVLTTGMNGLAHCAEGLYSRTANFLTDALAVQGARLFGATMPRYAEDPTDLDNLAEMLSAAAIGGVVISNARVGLHHACCHVLGAAMGLSHGVANTVMLPYVLEFNAPDTGDRQAAFADALARGMGVDAEIGAPALVRTLTAQCGLPTTLQAAGIARADLDRAAKEVMQDRGLYFNPRRVEDVSQIRDVLERAWSGRLESLR